MGGIDAGNARGALIDDARMLQVLAGETGEFDHLRTDGRFDFFANRAVKDLGLPDPTGKAEIRGDLRPRLDCWRPRRRRVPAGPATGKRQDHPARADSAVRWAC